MPFILLILAAIASAAGVILTAIVAAKLGICEPFSISVAGQRREFGRWNILPVKRATNPEAYSSNAGFPFRAAAGGVIFILCQTPLPTSSMGTRIVSGPTSQVQASRSAYATARLESLDAA